MANKGFFILCVQTLIIQSALSQCIGQSACGPISLGYNGATGCAAPFIPAASSGGSFVVTSSSPVAPTGISIVSENMYEGALCAGGNLPLLGSVIVEGEFLTEGAGAVSYGCGDESVAIVAEDGSVVTGIVAPVTAAPLNIAPRMPRYVLPVINNYGISYGYNGIGYNFGRVGYGPRFYGIGYGYGCGY